MDWNKMLTPDLPLLEMFVRGSIMYLGIFLILRLVLRREAGSLGTTDLLMVTVIADAAQNGMASSYTSVTNGLVLVLTIIFWNFFLDFAAFRFPRFERLMSPPPVCLIDNGKIQRQNMKREMVTKDDLEGCMREHGIERVEEVKKAWIESDGKISIIAKK